MFLSLVKIINIKKDLDNKNLKKNTYTYTKILTKMKFYSSTSPWCN